MTTDKKLILDLKKLVLSVAQIDDMRPEDIDEQDSLFDEGLGLDSIDLLELVVALDKKFGLKVRNDESGHKILQNIKTIALAIEGLDHKT